jgi:hypothetical protein
VRLSKRRKHRSGLGQANARFVAVARFGRRDRVPVSLRQLGFGEDDESGEEPRRVIEESDRLRDLLNIGGMLTFEELARLVPTSNPLTRDLQDREEGYADREHGQGAVEYQTPPHFATSFVASPSPVDLFRLIALLHDAYTPAPPPW